MLAEIHSMELIAETVKVILDENQVKRCVLAGHSMGYVALAFSEKYPEMMQVWYFSIPLPGRNRGGKATASVPLNLFIYATL